MNRFSCQSRIVLETLCACCHLYGNFNPLLVGTNHDPSWNLITERRNPGFISSKWNKEFVNYLKVHRSNNERQCQREKLFFVQNSRKYRNIFSENSIKKEIVNYWIYYLQYKQNATYTLVFKYFDSSKIKICTYKRKFGF